jgi:two-component system nitrate/nitrite response regulator NarL
MSLQVTVDAPSAPAVADVPDEVRVLVIDDHPIVGEGVARLLGGSHIRMLGCVPRIEDAGAFSSQDPHVILLDLRLGRTFTAPLVPALRQLLPKARIALFTAFPDHASVTEALNNGAVCRLVKDIGQTDLVASIVALAAGRPVGDKPKHTQDSIGLSPQEKAILLRVARGDTNNEIARELLLAPNTVKTYWHNAMNKLRVRNRAEAISRAHEVGLL